MVLPSINLLPNWEAQTVERMSVAEQSVMRRMRDSRITAQYAPLLRPTN